MKTRFVVISLLCFTLYLADVDAQTLASSASPAPRDTVSAQAQEENMFASKDFWAVGLQAGLLSGSGLGVRYHPAGRFSGQFVIGGFKTKSLSTYDFGIEGQFDFDTDGRSRFYGFIGGGYYYWDDKADGNDPKQRLKAPGRLGLGIMYEWKVSEKLIFSAGGAITYFTDGVILPLPQFGLYYYFN